MRRGPGGLLSLLPSFLCVLAAGCSSLAPGLGAPCEEATPDALPAGATPVAHAVLSRHDGDFPGRCAVVTDGPTLERFWALYYEGIQDPPAAPQVDFATHRLAAFHGPTDLRCDTWDLDEVVAAGGATYLVTLRGPPPEETTCLEPGRVISMVLLLPRADGPVVLVQRTR